MPDSSNDTFGYPPFGTLKAVAEDVWIVDGAPRRRGVDRCTTRMTAVRLSNGDLWLHSPVRFGDELAEQLETLGPIKHMVVPKVSHCSLTAQWRQHYPGVTTWGPPNCRRRRNVRGSNGRIERELVRGATPWNLDIDLLVIPSFGGFREVAFLHRASRTLILTDLLQSLEANRISTRASLSARATGTLYPRAAPPVPLRAALLLGGDGTRQALFRLIDWRPARVVFSRGRWFSRHGAAALEDALGPFARG